MKLRKVLREAGLGAINVGQVEDFQGAECRVRNTNTYTEGR
jgi:hypothetical protein